MEDLYKKLKGQDKPELQELLRDLDKLNEYQKAAVLDHSRVLLLNAQVGSGKTTVLIQKILYLHFVKGVPFESMVVLTFTNKAAEEIKTRIKEKNRNIKEEELRFFGTFHGVCRMLLSSVLPVFELGYTSEFSICDPDEMLELYERVININKLDLKYKNKIRKRIEQHRQGKPLYGNMKRDDDLAEFIKLLEAEKKNCNVMEFDDLIENTTALLRNHEYTPEWIIIDEFQDSDDRQLELIQSMKGDKTHIFAVGDPNQVIYTWRGSRKDIFGEFRKAYNGNELTLPINYRSTSTILDAAKAFLGPGQLIRGIRDVGKPIVVKKHHNTFNEALYLCDRIRKLVSEGFKYGDIAILYRKQKQSEVFKDVFEKSGIPYEVRQKKTFSDKLELYEGKISDESAKDDHDTVKLMTLHASKGLEFRCVFISAANLGLIPIPERSPGEEEEEKRLFFVGITRAKDYLEVSYHTNPDEFGVYGIPSPYLRMIPPELIESEDFVSRGANLSDLRREIKYNIDIKKVEPENQEYLPEVDNKVKVYHEKYGQGIVINEDEVNITVEFEVYGRKVFSKAFCPLKYEG